MIFKNTEPPIIFNSSKFESDANKWIRISANGTRLPTNNDLDIEKYGQFSFNQITKTITGQLIFSKIQEADKGIYYCTALNQHSSMLEQTQLVINGWKFIYLYSQINQIDWFLTFFLCSSTKRSY
jgi:hypothetical protein